MSQTRSAALPVMTPAALFSPLRAVAGRFDWRTWAAAAGMIAAVMAIYIPIPSGPGPSTLIGLDFFQMHLHRLQFAHAALLGPHPHLPSWYPRELLGTPFWSNVQDFPFLPTRLLLLAFNPYDALAVGVNLAAVLAALFTFLYARQIGLTRLGCAAAGWTFACAGFFASRVMAGHLPLLEVYPALPLLLWLVERWHAAPAEGKSRPFGLLALGLACGCIALAGHPQLPVYAVAAAAGYALYRSGVFRGARAVAAMGAGVVSAAFVLWPMWLLVRRSTRLLALDPPGNDIAFPYRRLIAFVFPWVQGWTGPVRRTPVVLLEFSNAAYFWDTVCYVGWLPLLAAGFLLVRALVRRKTPQGPWRFVVCLAVGALLLALPAAQRPLSYLPGTVLRSPARLIYLTTFGLALGLGSAADVLLAWTSAARRRWVFALPGLALAAHLLDLGGHDRQFIVALPYQTELTETESQLAQAAGDGRVAIDCSLATPLNRQFDDIGFFDSIALAKPYAALLDLGGRSSRLNTECLDGSDLETRALAACGVKFEMTMKQPRGLPDSKGMAVAFPIPDTAPLAAFYPLDQIMYLDPSLTHQRLRDQQFDLSRWLMLPPDARPDSPIPSGTIGSSVGSTERPTEMHWWRDSEDQVMIDVKNREAGYLRWLGAWDPGWSATVDAEPAPALLADDVFIAVPLSPGTHRVCLTFSTPGAMTGAVVSAIGLLSLVAISFWPHGRPRVNVAS